MKQIRPFLQVFALAAPLATLLATLGPGAAQTPTQTITFEEAATLLAAMARAGVERLVHAGSVVVYGSSRYDCPEHGRVRPAGRTEADLAALRKMPAFEQLLEEGP